jgi:GntR family transcriptional repressor for pyruvate dehydrogenase complex
MGVIEIRHGGGAFVSALDMQKLLAPLDLVLSLTPNIIADAAEARLLIECEAVRKATRNASEADILELDEMMNAHANVADDLIGFRILDSRFHGKIYALASNAVLERMANSLYNMGLDVRRRVMGEPGQIGKSTQDHIRIVEAMKAHKPDAAAAAMEVHLKHIAETTEAMLARAG